MADIIFAALFILSLSGLSVFGFQSLVLSLLYLYQRRRGNPEQPPTPEKWPTVTVQLPIYNEQYVVERLIDGICNLDYPGELLSIQVLDDSTDLTTEIARRRVEFHRAQGANIHLVHRTDRSGFKAGALAAGLQSAPGELLAILDADFVPSTDFLRRMVPYLADNPRVGMVQARWGHLNAEYSPITRGQALFLDGHFVIEQTARYRSGLLFNFNGSAGIWRRTCIVEAGGWRGDTLAEDLDLSYRAQIKGWQMLYAPEVVVPAEIPPEVAAFKRQQYRWAHGAIRVLLKLSHDIWRAQLSLPQRFGSFIHLSAYLSHSFMFLFLLVSLPVVLVRGVRLPPLQWLSFAGFGPPLLFALSQWAIYPDWKRRFAYFPILFCLGFGLGLSNTVAALAAFTNRPAQFTRTPKFHLQSKEDTWLRNAYQLPIEWTVWGELALAGYALTTTLLAVERLPGLAPVLASFTLVYGYVGGMGLWQGLEKRARLRIRKNHGFVVK